jgi:hypothetical protein
LSTFDSKGTKKQQQLPCQLIHCSTAEFDITLIVRITTQIFNFRFPGTWLGNPEAVYLRSMKVGVGKG